MASLSVRAGDDDGVMTPDGPRAGIPCRVSRVSWNFSRGLPLW
jgi:hypothetical protein